MGSGNLTHGGAGLMGAAELTRTMTSAQKLLPWLEDSKANSTPVHMLSPDLDRDTLSPWGQRNPSPCTLLDTTPEAHRVTAGGRCLSVVRLPGGLAVLFCSPTAESPNHSGVSTRPRPKSDWRQDDSPFVPPQSVSELQNDKDKEEEQRELDPGGRENRRLGARKCGAKTRPHGQVA